jgi:hypothetical protein
MDKKTRKIIIILLAAALLTPIGILLPYWLNGGDAWGEWSTDTIKEKTGYIPSGMQRIAAIWKSPVSDYSLSKEKSVTRQSIDYVISAVLGLTIITAFSYLLFRLVRKK